MGKLKTAAVLSVALLLAGCGEESAKRAIEANGFTNVSIAGFVWWGCGEHDSVFYNTKFAATGLNGKPITGVACGGWLKSWTVRID